MYRAPVRGGKDVEIKARPSFFSKLFQTSPAFLQAFPKKALAVLCNFRGLQGSQTKRVLSKFFLPHRPTFDRVLGVIAPHSTASRSVGASAICVAGERGRVHGRKSQFRTGRSSNLALISIRGKKMSAQLAREGVARRRRLQQRQDFCPTTPLQLSVSQIRFTQELS